MRKFFIYGLTTIMYADFLEPTKNNWYNGLLWLTDENKFDNGVIPIYAPRFFDTFNEAKKYIKNKFELSVIELSKAIDITVERKGNQAYNLHHGELTLVQINRRISYDLVKAQTFIVKEKKFGESYTMDASHFDTSVNKVREGLLLDLEKQGLPFF